MSEQVDDTPKDDFDIDTSRVNPDDFEKQVAAGGLIPPGFYMATLHGAVRGQTKGNEEKGTPPRAKWSLTFRISGGVYDGRDVEDALLAPLGKQAMEQRVLLYKSRLGLIKRTADGKAFETVPGKTDFMDCLDTKVIIHVKHREFPKDDGTKGHAVEMDFNGVHYPDDPKALEKIGKVIEPKATASGATGAKAEPAKKKFDPTTDL